MKILKEINEKGYIKIGHKRYGFYNIRLITVIILSSSAFLYVLLNLTKAPQWLSTLLVFSVLIYAIISTLRNDNEIICVMRETGRIIKLAMKKEEDFYVLYTDKVYIDLNKI